MKQAILFGGIGTLIETSEVQREAFNAAFSQSGLNWNWSAPAYQEMLASPGGIERIVSYARSQGNDDVSEATAADIHALKTQIFKDRLETGGLTARPGVLRILRTCRDSGIGLGFATTTYPETIAAVLSAIGLTPSHFDVVMHRGLVENTKPAAEVYTRCLLKLGIEAAQALAIEDSESGLAAATAAEIPCIVTPGANTLGQDYAQALSVVSHLGDTDNPYQWLGGAQPTTVDVIEPAAWLQAA